MKDDVLEAAPPTGVRFEQGTEIARLVEVLATPFYRLDADIDQFRRDRYLETATGIELERRADPVGVGRREGEGDESLRIRALSGRARASSGATFDDFANVALKVLDCDPNDIRIKVDFEDELGAIIVEVNSNVIEESPLTTDQIINQLEGSIMMSRRVVLRLVDVATWGEADKGWGTQWGGDIE